MASLGICAPKHCLIELVVANSTGVSYPAINPSLLTSLPIAFPRSLATQSKLPLFLDWKNQPDRRALIAKKQKRCCKSPAKKRLAVITPSCDQGPEPGCAYAGSGDCAWLGDIPAHWEIKSLRRVVSNIESGGGHRNAKTQPPHWMTGCGQSRLSCNGGTFNPEENKTLPSDP